MIPNHILRVTRLVENRLLCMHIRGICILGVCLACSEHISDALQLYPSLT
jgi:hypothetical protein